MLVFKAANTLWWVSFMIHLNHKSVARYLDGQTQTVVLVLDIIFTLNLGGYFLFLTSIWWNGHLKHNLHGYSVNRGPALCRASIRLIGQPRAVDLPQESLLGSCRYSQEVAKSIDGDEDKKIMSIIQDIRRIMSAFHDDVVKFIPGGWVLIELLTC